MSYANKTLGEIKSSNIRNLINIDVNLHSIIDLSSMFLQSASIVLKNRQTFLVAKINNCAFFLPISLVDCTILYLIFYGAQPIKYTFLISYFCT